MGDGFWKDRYRDAWRSSSSREKRLMRYLRERAGLKVEPYGLGAGTTSYIEGTASSNHHEKGDADLHVVGTDIYIEVTGPLSERVTADKPLWFRPDKIENAVRHRKDGTHDTFLANNYPGPGKWFVVHVDDEFCKAFEASSFTVVHPTIRGTKETYIEIPTDDARVTGLDALVAYLKFAKERIPRAERRTSRDAFAR